MHGELVPARSGLLRRNERTARLGWLQIAPELAPGGAVRRAPRLVSGEPGDSGAPPGAPVEPTNPWLLVRVRKAIGQRRVVLVGCVSRRRRGERRSRVVRDQGPVRGYGGRRRDRARPDAGADDEYGGGSDHRLSNHGLFEEDPTTRARRNLLRRVRRSGDAPGGIPEGARAGGARGRRERRAAGPLSSSRRRDRISRRGGRRQVTPKARASL